jgi:cytochrome c-type biogenesis protein CcmH/NrfG
MQFTEFNATMALVTATMRRAPSSGLPRALEHLFSRLAACQDDTEAAAIEDRIWDLWMYHPHRRAARDLDRAATEIAAHCHDVAETRLNRLLRAAPDYSEAWNKRATLYYLQERDDECLYSLHRVLQLEPRHFGALCALAEILLSRDDREGALLAFEAALRIHPHLDEARQRVSELRSPAATH